MQLLSYNITNLEMFSLFTSIFFYRFFILLSACFRVILRFPSIYLSCLIIANYPYCLSVNYFYLFFVYSTCPRCSSRHKIILVLSTFFIFYFINYLLHSLYYNPPYSTIKNIVASLLYYFLHSIYIFSII